MDVRPNVERFTRTGVVFGDGAQEEFDAVIAATGFTPGLEHFTGEQVELDERGLPRDGAAAPGLFFAGYSETPRGALFEANRAAPRLARAIERHLGSGE